MQVPPIIGPWLAVFATLLAILAAEDVRARRLPNPHNALLFFLGLAHAATNGALIAACAGACMGALLLWWPHTRRWIGGGDLKLLAAIGAWTGTLGVIWVLLIAAIVSGVLSLIALVR